MPHASASCLTAALPPTPPHVQSKTGGLSFLHTSHCLGTGEVMISGLGEAKDGKARGGECLARYRVLFFLEDK